jgi:DNA polymerase-1
MVTPDKDFAQLVSEIYMYKPARMGNGIEIWVKFKRSKI